MSEREFLSTGFETFAVAYTIACLWIKAFYWMRVFERPAFFVLLIKETLIGIIPFMILLLIVLVLFANILYIYNVSKDSIGLQDHTSLYPNDSYYSFFNACIHIYLLGLGTFDVEHFSYESDDREFVIRAQFLVATLII